MAWLHFTAPFDFTPRRQRGVTIAYLPAMRCLVTRECARAAVAAGVAEEIETPNRTEAEKLTADPYWTAAGERRKRLEDAAGAEKAAQLEAATEPPPATRPTVNVDVDLPTGPPLERPGGPPVGA